MSIAPPAEPETTDWFAQYQGTQIGQTFIGDRSRLHIADVTVVEPNAVALDILCGAGATGDVDVSTVVRNARLDGGDRNDCESWWEKKVRLTPEAGVSQMLPGGLRKPRICGACQRLREQRMQ